VQMELAFTVMILSCVTQLHVHTITNVLLILAHTPNALSVGVLITCSVMELNALQIVIV
jgi:hypothetical protein